MINNNQGGIGPMPTFDEKVKNQAQAQSDFKLRQAVMDAPQKANPNQLATQLGAQSATQQAAQAQQMQQSNISNQLEQNQKNLQQQQVKQQQKQQKNQIKLTQDRRNNENQLAEMNSEMKSRMIDQQKQFEEIQGRAVITRQQQMRDYMIAKQANEQEWREYKQAAETGHRRRLNSIRNTHAIIRQNLQNNYNEIVRDYGIEKAEELKKLEARLNKQLKEEQERGNLIGTIAGVAQFGAGVAMAATGNPMGIGMAVGGLTQTMSNYGNGKF